MYNSIDCFHCTTRPCHTQKSITSQGTNSSTSPKLHIFRNALALYYRNLDGKMGLDWCSPPPPSPDNPWSGSTQVAPPRGRREENWAATETKLSRQPKLRHAGELMLKAYASAAWTLNKDFPLMCMYAVPRADCVLFWQSSPLSELCSFQWEMGLYWRCPYPHIHRLCTIHNDYLYYYTCSCQMVARYESSFSRYTKHFKQVQVFDFYRSDGKAICLNTGKQGI